MRDELVKKSHHSEKKISDFVEDSKEVLRPQTKSGMYTEPEKYKKSFSEDREEIIKKDYEGDIIAKMDDAIEEQPMDEISSSSNAREINIKPLDSGYLVTVGCQKVAVESTETLVENLNAYLSNPSAYQRVWNRKRGQNKLSKVDKESSK